ARQGLPAGVRFAAHAFLVSRRRRLRAIEGCPGGHGLITMTTHAEQRVVPYTPEQMYALVADIERYPEFLPWCVAARIRERRADFINADLVIGFRVFRERFASHVKLDPPGRIDVTYAEGPFRYLNNYWLFERAPGG